MPTFFLSVASIPLIGAGGLGLLTVAAIVAIFIIIIAMSTRYKKCPSDRVMVIYGRVAASAPGIASTAAPPSSSPSSKTTASCPCAPCSWRST